VTTTPTYEPLPLRTEDGRIHPAFGFLAIHRALRRDAERFVVAAPTALADREAHAALAAHWERYRELLEFHHRFEDAQLLPLMRREAPELSPLLDEMAAEHHDLDELLPRITAIVRSERPDAPAAGAAFESLSGLLHPHLAAEEVHLVPVMERVFGSRNGDGGPDGGERREGGPAQNPDHPEFWVPWMGEQLEEDLVAESLATLPEEHRAAYPRWLEEYRAGLARWIP